MRWMGWLLGGLALAWLVVGRSGWGSFELIVLAGVGAVVIGRMQDRIARTERRLQQLESLQAQIAALKASGAALATPEAPAAFASPPMQTPAAPAAPAPVETEWLDTMPPLAPPPPAALRRPVEADERSLVVTTSIGASLLAWFKGGNTIVRVAVLILFIGVAFLLRYAAERTTVPIEWRLAGVALGGFALAALGLRLVARRRAYGLSLQGAGIGIVYLALFAAFRLYALVPPGLTFALLGGMAAITAMLALSQDALPLAVLGFGGAFLAPVLTSTGQGSHVALFGYFLLLNLAIAWIADRRSWKLLNLVGFVFTFGIGALWGAKAYTNEHFASTEPFLVAHFALYLYVAVRYTQRLVVAPETKQFSLPVVDGTLLFGVPIVAFGLQAAMLRGQPLALAASAAALAAVYLLVGRWLWRQAGERMLLLVEGLLALGVIFLILVTPLALDARWTGAAWAIQGAGVVWVGLRQKRWWAAGLGLLLQLAAAASYWSHPARAAGALAFANAAFVGALVLAAAALFSARLLQRLAASDALPASPAPAQGLSLLHALMLAIGIAHAWAGGWVELTSIDARALDHAFLAAALSAAFVVPLESARQPLGWPALGTAARVLLIVALLASLGGLLVRAPSVASLWARYVGGFGLVEALGLVALGLWLARRSDAAAPRDGFAGAERVLLGWFAMLHGGVFLYVAGAHALARHLGWTPAAAIVVPTLIALALVARAADQRFPVAGHARAFVVGLLEPWLALLALWVLAVNAFSDASMAPLPYLPLLNPIDLAHALVALYALRLWRVAAPSDGARRTTWVIAAALGFWWLNALLVRSLHHWAGTPMWADGALGSALVQTGLTVLWTCSALLTMLAATRRAARGAWMAGAVLLGVVVVKLFLVDLSNVGTLPRIVSFLAVGALMLVIGYVSPLPPAVATKEAAT
jgi:uncharacterized membrane protein